MSLETPDVRHAARVLRLRAGDPIVIVSDGRAWDAAIVDLTASAATARVSAESSDAAGELPIEVTILQALTKGAKFDAVVEKCVELGARRIVPVVCERSLARSGDAKINRWRRIARSAASQSRRRLIPVVEQAMPWRHAIESSRWGATLVAHERARPRSLGDALASLAREKSIAIAVGPEGSFTPAELDAAEAAGARFVSLGPTILRTETAAAALLAAIASHYW